VKNVRFVLDLFDKLSYPPDKVMLTLNRNPEDRNLKKLAIPPEKIEQYLKRPIVARIPTDEMFVWRAVQRAVPVVAAERDKTKSPIKELLDLSNRVHLALMPAEEEIVALNINLFE
jgi:hypothetical protein